MRVLRTASGPSRASPVGEVSGSRDAQDAIDVEGGRILRPEADHDGLVDRLNAGDHLISFGRRNTLTRRILAAGRQERDGRPELPQELQAVAGIDLLRGPQAVARDERVEGRTVARLGGLRRLVALRVEVGVDKRELADIRPSWPFSTVPAARDARCSRGSGCGPRRQSGALRAGIEGRRGIVKLVGFECVLAPALLSGSPVQTYPGPLA